MNSLQLYRDNEVQNSDFSVNAADASFVDMATIRQRVATIKKRWSPETAKARDIEGARRRFELEALLANAPAVSAAENCSDERNFSVVM